MTLAHLCLQGDVQDVVLGDVLGRLMLLLSEKVVGRKEDGVLAAFSIGGESGMSMDIVAGELGLRLDEVRRIVTELADAGIVYEVGQQSLSVRPAALRWVLTRDVFFKGASAKTRNLLPATCLALVYSKFSIGKR